MKNSGATSALCVTDIYLRGYRKVSIVQYQKIRWYSIALKYLSITVLPLLHDFYRMASIGITRYRHNVDRYP